MPKKAPQTDSIDPVRSRLAGAVAGPSSTAVPIERPQHQTATEPDASSSSSKTTGVSRPKPPTQSSSMTVNRKFMVSPQEADQIEQTLKMLKESFGSKVTLSQATRAMWTILSGCEEAMRRAGRRQVKRTAPSTGNAMALAEYEEEVAEFLEAIFKRS